MPPEKLTIPKPPKGFEIEDSNFGKGNIDLNSRPRVKNKDGSISTVRSVGVNIDGKEVLLPTVSEDGQILSVEDAVKQYKKTGKYLGIFDDVESSNAYAQKLHKDQERLIESPAPPPGFELEKSASTPAPPPGFEIERSTPAPPPGFEIENEVNHFGMADSLLKRVAKGGVPLALGTAAGARPERLGNSYALQIGDIVARAGSGESLDNMFPGEASFLSGLTKTLLSGAVQVPGMIQAGKNYAENNLPQKIMGIAAGREDQGGIEQNALSGPWSNLALRSITTTMKKMGMNEYNPKYDKMPDFLVNNPLADFFDGAAENLNYNQSRYGKENAFTLWNQGRPDEAADWTVNAVLENAPYTLFTLALNMAGVPATQVLAAASGVAGAGMMRETFNNPNLDEAAKFESLFLKASAEGASEYMGAKLFPVATGLFDRLGVKAGRHVIKNSLKEALSALAVGPMEEGIEEFATGMAQGAVDMFYRAKRDLTWKKVTEQAILDGFLGSISGVPYAAGAAAKSSLDVAHPEVVRQGLEASRQNAKNGVTGAGYTADDLIEIQVRADAKNKGITDPAGRIITVPTTLEADEVLNAQAAEEALQKGDFHDPQEFDLQDLSKGVTGEFVKNFAVSSFEDSIREKLASGETLDSKELEYLNYRQGQTKSVKGADLEAVAGMGSESFQTWAKERTKDEYKTPEEILQAMELHDAYIGANDVESAAAIREAVSRESGTGDAAYRTMESKEKESFHENSSPEDIDAQLEAKYAELDELDKMAVGDIGQDYESKAKTIIAEIQALEEQRKTASERQPSRPEARYSKKTKPTGKPGSKPAQKQQAKKPGNVREAVERIKKTFKNAPEVVLVSKVSDLPADIQHKDAEGVYYGGKVYLVEENLSDPARAEFVFLHEVVGHHGLKSILGDKLDALTDHLWRMNKDIRAQAQEVMTKHGYDKNIAVEEVLADMAGKNEKMPWWEAVYAFLRDAFRAAGIEIDLMDGDIKTLLQASRRYVKEGVKQSTITMANLRYSKRHDEAARVQMDITAAKSFLTEYKAFRQRIGKMKKYSGGYLAEELSDIPAYYWTKDENASTLDQVAEAEGLENDMALLDKIREMEALKITHKRSLGASAEWMDDNKPLLKEFDKGAKYGYSEGFKDARKETVQKMTENANDQQAIKDIAVEYAVNYLPKDLRGNLLTQVRDAKTPLDALKAFQKIDEIAETEQKKRVVSNLKRLISKVQDAHNVSVEYKQLIQDLADTVTFSTPRETTIARLKATKDYLDAEMKAGREVNFPLYVYESLKKLGQTPVAEMSLEALEELHDKIALAWELGRVKLRAREALYDIEKNKVLQAILDSDVNSIDTADLTLPGLDDNGNVRKLEMSDRLKNGYVKARNAVVLADKGRTPMDHLFSVMGDEVYRTFKAKIDAGWSEYQHEFNDIKKRTDDLVKELDLGDAEMKRIGIYAANQQEGGRQKLLNQFTESEIDSVQLTENEMKFYEFMRSELDAIRPEYERFLRDVFNLPLGKVAGYFPFMTDFEAMADWEIRDRFAQMTEFNPALKKTVDLGSQKKRIDKKGSVNVRIDAGEVFTKHMDDVLYAINLGKDIKMLQEIAKTAAFRGKVGDMGQRLVVEWMDLLARKGGVRTQAWERKINTLRRNVGISMLSLNPASIIVQTTAAMDGAMLIGNWAFEGQKMLASKEWREFALQASGELRGRVGDDFAYLELSKSTADKMREKSMFPQRYIDSLVASGVWIGGYLKYLNENGMTPDTANPSKEAVLYADKMMRMTQASNQFKDLPLMLSKGVGFGDNSTIAKLFNQFKTFGFYRYANLVDMTKKAIEEKDYKTAAQIVSWNIGATITEMAIRHGVKGAIGAIIASLVGAAGDEEYDEATFSSIPDFLKSLFKTQLGNVPFVSDAMAMWEYSSFPSPVLSHFEKIMDSLSYYQKSKDQGKKMKWATVGLLQLSAFGGVPGSMQAAKYVKQIDKAQNTKPFMRDASSKLRVMTKRYKETKANIDSQVEAMKENPSSYDTRLVRRADDMSYAAGRIQKMIKRYNKYGEKNERDLAEIERDMSVFLKNAS